MAATVTRRTADAPCSASIDDDDLNWLELGILNNIKVCKAAFCQRMENNVEPNDILLHLLNKRKVFVEGA